MAREVSDPAGQAAPARMAVRARRPLVGYRRAAPRVVGAEVLVVALVDASAAAGVDFPVVGAGHEEPLRMAARRLETPAEIMVER